MEKLTEMKAVINSENKAKFFAQYWGQDVLSSSMYGDGGTIYCLTMKEDSHDGKWLLLKPLSQISDEDAIQIALMDGCSEKSSEEFKISLGRCKVDKDHPLGKKVLTQLEADYLRSKGYAITWMGLSVEEMIEAGWIKLKQ